jgi:CDP-diacylglycerol--serine O-phosphatidyltransferase
MIPVVRRRRRHLADTDATRASYAVAEYDSYGPASTLARVDDTARRLIESVPISPAPAGAATLPILPGEVAPSVPRTIPLLPGEQTIARRMKFAMANGCTLASLMLGLSAIFLAMHGDTRVAALALLGCVIFDGADGALARRLGVASPFGAQMDSLVDMCSFGIAAPVVVYSFLHGQAPTPLIAVACATIAAGAAIRLARFNVSPKDGRFFCGVPTTMTAAVMGIAVLIGLRLPGPVAVVAVALLGLAMVSGFPYAKLARLAKLPPWFWIVPIAGMILDYQITFALLVLAYLISGPLLWLRQRGDHHAATA